MNPLITAITNVITATAETKLEYIIQNNPKSVDAFVEKYTGETHRQIDANDYKETALAEITEKLPFKDGTGAYTAWVALKYPLDPEMKIEDVPHKIGKALEQYDALKKKVQNKTVTIEGFRSDINSFKTFTELEDYVDKLAGDVGRDYGKATSPEAEALYKNKDAEIVAKSGDVTIVKLNTFKASTYFSAGTKWCTSGEGMYDHYSNQGPLFVIFTPEGRFQFHMESTQYMDEKDRDIKNLPAFLDKYPVVRKTFANSSLAFLDNPTEEQLVTMLSADSLPAYTSLMSSTDFKNLYSIASKVSMKATAVLLARTIKTSSEVGAASEIKTSVDNNGVLKYLDVKKPSIALCDALLHLPTSLSYNRKVVLATLHSLATTNQSINEWFINAMQDKAIAHKNPATIPYFEDLTTAEKIKALAANFPDALKLMDHTATVKTVQRKAGGKRGGGGTSRYVKTYISQSDFDDIYLEVLKEKLATPEHTLLLEGVFSKLADGAIDKYLSLGQVKIFISTIVNHGYWALASIFDDEDDVTMLIDKVGEAGIVAKMIEYNTDKNFVNLSNKLNPVCNLGAVKDLPAMSKAKIYASGKSGPIVKQLIVRNAEFLSQIAEFSVRSKEDALDFWNALVPNESKPGRDFVDSNSVNAFVEICKYLPQKFKLILNYCIAKYEEYGYEIAKCYFNSQSNIKASMWFASELEKLPKSDKIKNVIFAALENYGSTIFGNLAGAIAKLLLDKGYVSPSEEFPHMDNPGLFTELVKRNPDMVFSIVGESTNNHMMNGADKELIALALKHSTKEQQAKIENTYKVRKPVDANKGKIALPKLDTKESTKEVLDTHWQKVL